jgi:hypothetical protein
MAGVQGQGSPEQLQSAPPIAPEPMALPAVNIQPQVAETNPLDAIYGADQGGSPLDAIYGQAPAEQVEERGFFQKMEGSLGPTEKMIKKAVIDAPLHLAKAATALPGGIAQEIDREVKSGDGDIGRGVIDAVKDPDKVAPLAQSLESLFPVTKAKLKAPVTNLQDYAEARAGNENYEAVLTNKSVDTIPVSEAIALYAELESGNLAVKGITKAAAMTKLGVKHLGAVAEGLHARKASKLESAINPVETLSKDVEEIKAAADSVSKLGTKVPLTPRMANPGDPVTQSIAKELANNKVYMEVEEEIGNRIVKNITEDIPKSFANLSDDAMTTDEIFSTLKGAKKSSGKRIEGLKQKASEAFGNGRIQAKGFTGEVDNVLDSLTTPDEAKKLYISDAARREELVNYVENLNEELFNNKGGLTFQRWEQIYQEISLKSRKSFDKDTSYVWNKLRGSLSKEQDGMLAVGLKGIDDEAARAFVSGKESYSAVMKAQEDIGNLISKDGIAADSFIKNLFFSEASSVDRASSAYKVLGFENPKSVQDLSGRAYKYILNESAVPISPKNPFGVDFQKFTKTIEKLQGSDPKSKNLLDLITGSKDGSKAMMDLAKTAENFANGYAGRSEVLNETLFGRMFFYADKVNKNPKSWVMPIVDAIQRDKKLAEVFGKMDIAEVVKGFPPNKRAEAEAMIRQAMKK